MINLSDIILGLFQVNSRTALCKVKEPFVKRNSSVFFQGLRGRFQRRSIANNCLSSFVSIRASSKVFTVLESSMLNVISSRFNRLFSMEPMIDDIYPLVNLKQFQTHPKIPSKTKPLKKCI